MSNRSRGGSKRKKQNNSAGNSNNKNKNKKQSNNGKKKFDAAAFWGDPAAIPNPEGFDTTTPDPVAVVNSLGQPPLPGHGAASPHYFTLVYNRAAQLAGALAMAGEIDDLTPDDPPEPEVVEPGNDAGEDAGEVDGNTIDDESDDDDDDELAETDADEDTPPVKATSDDEE